MARTFTCLFFLIAISASIEAQSPSLDLKKIEFEGNRVFSSEALRKTLDSCYTRHIDQKGGADNGLRNYCLQTDVLNLIRRDGYLEAKIDNSKGGEKSLIIEIEEGLRYRLGKIKITGSSVFTSRQLLIDLDLDTGHIANGPQLQQWAYEHIKERYADIGHLQYTCTSEPTFRRDPENPVEGIVDIHLEIDEGPRFQIGRIEFIGNVVVPDQALRRTMLIGENEIFRRNNLIESIKRINDMGLFERIDHDKDVEFRADPKSPTIDIIIRLSEKRN